MPNNTQKHRCIVVKLGGSVLHRSNDYDRCAAHLANLVSEDGDAGLRRVVVVSARFGHTDRLLRAATRAGGCEKDAPTALWLATGELQSVALLTIRLKRLGLRASGIGPHQTGIHVAGSNGRAPELRVDVAEFERLLAKNEIVVVPGFIGTDAAGQWATLGRGGSDLTAVVLAAALDAERCELVKDVPGYFTSDPNVDAGAQPIPHLSHDDALAMAAGGCDLVQPESLELARQHRLQLIIRDLNTRERETVVSADRADDSRNRRVEAITAI